MKELTFILLERIGLLLIIAFVLTRIPSFKTLLYRENDLKTTLMHSLLFGLFGVISSHFGLIFVNGVIVDEIFVLSVEEDQMLISLSLIAVVIAGLLGGPKVGLGAGIITGLHLMFLGGIGWFANMLVNPITGLLAGLTGQFFSKARVISPIQALFIGVFPPILQMQLLLVLYPQNTNIISFVNVIGLPLVLSSSIAIAIFTAMIGIVLREQEDEAAHATRQALTIAEEALPFLKKETMVERANGIADLLYERLDVAAIAVTDGDEVLAFKGIGADHHRLGQKIMTPLSKAVLDTEEIKIAYSKDEIECINEDCPLEAAIIIPIIGTNNQTSLIKFYFKKAQHIRPVEKVLAQGIGQLISNQLKVISNENLRKNIIDAELRNLQAQINPHFLFNTLHLIATLFRIDPKQARHITIQLANFMRFNLGITAESLISIEREYEHVQAYIEIIQMRFAKQFDIEIKRDRTVNHVLIPPSTIQPLVENSIQHGLKDIASGGRIRIVIESQENHVVISVEDNGKGFDEEKLNMSAIEKYAKTEKASIEKGGMGLYNVNQRLVSLLGEDSRLRMENLHDGGSKVSFIVPNRTSVRGKNNEIECNDSGR